MSDTGYPECINELYQSEVLGEQAFLALVDAARNERDRYHFGTFLQLESETKARLRPLLQKYGMPFVEHAEAREAVAGFAALYTDNEWQGFLAQLKPLIEHFITRFQEIADAGPAEDREVLQSMVTHEQSFIHWIEKEMAGEPGGLELAIDQLNFPLAEPAG
jgi:hypothetical protein